MAQLPDQATQGEVSGVGGEDRSTVGVGQVDPNGLGDLCQKGRRGVLGIGGGCQQKTAGGAGEGHDEHAALVGAYLGTGSCDGSTALARGFRAVSSCRQTVGDRVNEEAGASQGVPQAQVRPAVPLQPGHNDELPLLARAARRGHDGDTLRAPSLGSDGVRGQDLGVELGQEAGRVLAGVALGPDLRTLEQRGDDVEVVLGGLGQQRAY